jgi:CRISPR-associated endonuclease/helicase Cas3
MTVVAVVVNRVNRARHIFDEIERRGARPFQEYGQDDAEDGSSEVALLIGRARAMDRDRLTIALLPRIRAGRNRDEFKRPLFIVATQCVEAGADLDFDALVTELAPLDSLRQRFGRLNRLGHIDKNQDGERGELQSDQSRAVILAANDQAAKKVKPDPIYGEASKNTWDWLCARCHTQGKGKKASYVIDFGVVASEKWIPRNKELENCIAPRLNAPVLLPRDLTLWTMTSPIPAVDSEVSLYLHGPKTGPGDVEVVWRADIDEGMSAVEWKDRLRVCPPSALEALAVPFSEAKRWLRREASADIPDVEAGEGEEDERGRKEARMVLRWRGPDDERTELISGRRISPGDVIVVPSAWGGCDRWGWAPWKEEEVEDIGEDANEQGRGRVIVRVSPKLLKYALAQQGLHEQLCRTRSERFSGLLEELRESREREITGRIRDFSGLPDSWRRRLLQLGDRPIIERDPGDRPLALEMRRRGLVGNAATEDDDSARATQQAVPLDSHCLGVAQLAEHFAEQLGLDPNLVEDVALAGYLHDAGKAHPAFRRLLYGGAELSAIGGPPLAKSARLPASPAARAEVRRRSGFPKDARHEVASLAFAEGHPKFVQAHDPEIVLWLIGTHHGYGRPFFPLVEWPRTGDEMIEADLGDGSVSVKPSRCLAELTAQWIDLFVSVQARYGPWGLARLEAILRLADHRQSEAEQMEVEDNEAEATSGTKGAAA